MNFQAHFDAARSPTGLGPEEFVDALFADGCARWRPCFDRLAAQVRGFGEVDIVPGRTWIGFARCGRTFAIVQPAVGHLDVGLDCPGLPPAGRFRSAEDWNATVTHRLRIISQDDDDELIEWLRDAHEAAGLGAASGLRWSCD